MAAQKTTKEVKLTPAWIFTAITIIPPTVVGAMILFEFFGVVGAVIGAVVGGAIGIGIFMVLGAIAAAILPDRIFCKYTGAASTDCGSATPYGYERAFTQNQLCNKW